MPNWCNNTLELASQDDDQVKEIIERLVDQENRSVRFSNIVPVPDALEDLYDPEEDALNMELYGYTNSYDFCIGEWGTKWEGSLHSYNDYEIHFDTAWGPPTEFMLKLAKEYPTVDFILSYYEEGCVFAGIINYSEGAILCEEHTNERTSELFIDLAGEPEEEAVALLTT